MTKEIEDYPLPPTSLQSEMRTAAEDLKAVATLLIALGNAFAQGDLRPEWLAFVARGIEAIAENLEDVAGRLA